MIYHLLYLVFLGLFFCLGLVDCIFLGFGYLFVSVFLGHLVLVLISVFFFGIDFLDWLLVFLYLYFYILVLDWLCLSFLSSHILVGYFFGYFLFCIVYKMLCLMLLVVWLLFIYRFYLSFLSYFVVFLLFFYYIFVF